MWPGCILLVLGLVFHFNMLFGNWNITCPLYILSVAFGLFELYIFGGREKGLLIPVGILGGLSFLFFFSFSLNRLLRFNTRPYALPVLLIIIGIILIGGRRGRADKPCGMLLCPHGSKKYVAGALRWI